jgi:hypothetical protein
MPSLIVSRTDFELLQLLGDYPLLRRKLARATVVAPTDVPPTRSPPGRPAQAHRSHLAARHRAPRTECRTGDRLALPGRHIAAAANSQRNHPA